MTGDERTLDAIKRMVPAHTHAFSGIGWSARAEDLSNRVKLVVTSRDPIFWSAILGLAVLFLDHVISIIILIQSLAAAGASSNRGAAIQPASRAARRNHFRRVESVIVLPDRLISRSDAISASVR